jgi:hypothetical protein
MLLWRWYVLQCNSPIDDSGRLINPMFRSCELPALVLSACIIPMTNCTGYLGELGQGAAPLRFNIVQM